MNVEEGLANRDETKEAREAESQEGCNGRILRTTDLLLYGPSEHPEV